MKLRSIPYLLVCALAAVAVTAFKIKPPSLDKVFALLETKQIQAGKLVNVKAEVCYQSNGNMVTHYSYPRNYVILSNRQGEVKVYDPSNNTVIQYQNNLFSSQSTQFYYFFSGKAVDMGLSAIGYVPEKTYAEKDLIISNWKLKTPDKKALIQKVRLVHRNQEPVYMHYENASGKIIRKVFYYGYTNLNSMPFPSVTTEIIYNDQDSTVTKTYFSDFRLNEQAVSPYFDFKIPTNAKVQSSNF